MDAWIWSADLSALHLGPIRLPPTSPIRVPQAYLLITATLFVGLTSTAQNCNELIAHLRADLCTEKDAIIRSSLNLSEAEKNLLTPIYAQYKVALQANWAKRLSLVDDHTQAKEALSDKQAISFMERLTAIDREGVPLRDSYAKKVAKVIPATLASRWMALEC